MAKEKVKITIYDDGNPDEVIYVSIKKEYKKYLEEAYFFYSHLRSDRFDTLEEYLEMWDLSDEFKKALSRPGCFDVINTAYVNDDYIPDTLVCILAYVFPESEVKNISISIDDFIDIYD